MKKQPKCIIFDCDGVLVDSEPITARILIQMSQEIGVDIDMELWRPILQVILGRVVPH